MKTIMLSLDRRILDNGSAVQKRMISQSQEYDTLHIIVLVSAGDSFSERVNGRLVIHGLSARTKLGLWLAGLWRSLRILRNTNKFEWEISVQDPFFVGLLGWLVSRLCNIALQVQVHVDFINRFYKKLSIGNHIRYRIGKWVVQKAHKVRTVSNHTKRSLVGAGVTTDIVVLPVCLQKDFLVIEESGQKSLFPQFSHVLLFVGRFEKEKNLKMLVRSFLVLLEKYPQAGLVLVGDGSEKIELERYVKKHGIIDQVVFEGWQDSMLEYYQSADVLVVSSWYEGFGLVIAEALMAGCPVVSTNVGIAADVLPSFAVTPINDYNKLSESVQTVFEGLYTEKEMAVAQNKLQTLFNL